MTNLLPERTIGPNTVHHLDCFRLMNALPDKSVDAIITDVPYGKVNRETNGLRTINKGVADNSDFDLGKLLREFDRLMKGSLYIFCEWEQISPIVSYFRSALTVRLCIWEKTNPSPMNGESTWLSSTECCVFAKRNGATFNEFCASGVWRYPSVFNPAHPTQKPLALMQKIIRASSLPGDLILDPFAGSGTTLVAARNLGRRYIGGDITPEYVAVAKRRLSEPFMPPLFSEPVEREPLPVTLGMFA